MDKMQLFLDGLKLMVFGMGAVYAFLVLMIFCMGLMYKAIKPFIGIFETAPKQTPAAPRASGDDAGLAAVAAAAVELFRRSK